MAAAHPHPGGGVAASFVVFPPVAAAAPSLLFFDDDDGFGDFKFAPISITAPHQTPEEDEDWGEFVSSPAGSRPASSQKTTQPQLSSFDAFLADPSPNSSKSSQKSAWEKPRGALPLSLFGEEDREDEEEEAERKKASESPALPAAGFAFSSSAAVGREGRGSPLAAGDLTDLIKNLYSQTASTGALTNGNGDVVNSLPAEGGEGEYVEEDEWDFKNAISSTSKEEGKQILDISGEDKAPLDGLHVEVLDNRFGDTLQTAGHLDGINGGQGLANEFTNHEEINSSWKGFTGVSPENNGNHDSNHHPNGHVSDHTVENEGDDESWDFKSASSESKAVTSSWEEMNSSEAEFNIRNFSEREDTRSTSENNVNESTTHSYSNMKEVKLVENGINGKTYNSVKGSYSNILNLYNKYEKPNAVQFIKDPAVNGEASATFGYGDLHESQTKVPKTSEMLANNQKFMSDIDGINPLELTQDSSLDLYRGLRKGLTVLINHHLQELKEAQKAAALSGESKETEIANEINAVYEKLSSSNLPENDYNMDSLSRDVCVSLLLNQVGEPKSRVFEQEYHLSEKIRLADESLGAAIELLEHTNSMQSILALASNKDRIAYIAAWSNMSVVCARELKLGAAIWKKSLQAEASDQILHQDGRYFLALGEIHRVAEILRASVELYRPWILSNWDSSSTLLGSLEECSEAWFSSGLEKTMEIISDSDDELRCGVAKALLSSINKICGSSHQMCNKIICGLSLLPAAALEDMQMKMVAWNGQNYCLKVANLWANRISCDPPHLPQIYAR